jgi:hypothetical protein
MGIIRETLRLPPTRTTTHERECSHGYNKQVEHEFLPPLSLKLKPTFPPLPLSPMLEGEGRKRPEKISLKGYH